MVGRRPRTLRAWAIGWIGAAMLGVVNGALREFTYKERVGETMANQISSVTLIALLALYFVGLERRWPIPTRRQALAIGGSWVVLTVLFEFGFGHYVDRKSWAELVGNYDLRAGSLWLLILVWIALGPAATRRIGKPRTRSLRSVGPRRGRAGRALLG